MATLGKAQMHQAPQAVLGCPSVGGPLTNALSRVKLKHVSLGHLPAVRPKKMQQGKLAARRWKLRRPSAVVAARRWKTPFPAVGSAILNREDSQHWPFGAH